jgi:peptidoglycan/LPS O-acetylase OafA/YrhL
MDRCALRPQDARDSHQSSVSPPPTPRETAQRFVMIDALRGIAACSVVLYHLHISEHTSLVTSVLSDYTNTLIDSCIWPLGVPTFFVLSGFVIAHSLRGSRVDISFLARFAIRRSIRLDPPYWVSIALTLLAGFLAAKLIAGRSPMHLRPSAVLAHIFYAQDILGIESFNPIYWTLCLEIQFYLVFCALLTLVNVLCRNKSEDRWLGTVFIPAFSLSVAWPLGLLPSRPFEGSFLPMWHGFLAGALACWSYHKKVSKKYFYLYIIILFFSCFIHLRSFTLAFAITALLLHEAGCHGCLVTWLRHPAFQLLGKISYSLYLFHGLFISIGFNSLYRIVGRSFMTDLFCLILVTMLAILGSWVLWHIVERKSLVYSHRVRLNSTGPPR